MSTCSDTIPAVEIKCRDGTEDFIQQLKGYDFDTLKKMLKHYEQKEYYKWCRLIQNEIDSRVKCLTEKKWILYT